MSNIYWTPEEDEVLTQLVAKNIKWKEISEIIRRSKRGCIKRWNKINPCFRVGGWEKEEDVDLIDWLFSNLEERISPHHSLCENRRRPDILKRLEFLKKQLLDKMFPAGFNLCKKEESKVTNNSKCQEKKLKCGIKRKVKEEEKEKDENSDSEFDTEDQKCSNSRMNIKSFKVKEESSIHYKSMNKPQILQTDSLLHKSLSREQFYILAGIEESGDEWSKNEDEQLFELLFSLKTDWNSISRFIKHRSAESIHNHYINTLKWAAYEMKKDYDFKLNKLSKLFPQNELYIENPITECEDKLETLLPVAAYLLNINCSVNQESSISNQMQIIDEKERTWKICKQNASKIKDNSIQKIQNSISNPFVQKSLNQKNREISKFKFNSGIDSDEDSSEYSNCSETSDFNLLLNIK